MHNRILSWVRDGLHDWIAMTAIWIVGVLGFSMVAVFFRVCGNSSDRTLIVGCAAPAQAVLHWPWLLPATALMFLPGMWLWKTWRYTCNEGRDSGWAWAAGLLCAPWLLVVAVIVILIVLAAVIYESFLNGEAWANVATWQLTKVKVHEDEYGVLYRGITSWGSVLKVKVTDTKGDHWLTVRQATTAREAVALSFGLSISEYHPGVES